MTGLVTPQIAYAVLWHFGRPEGREPGHFAKALLEAISVADESNREKLRVGFPGHVEAFLAGAQETYGIQRLIAIAGAE